ncbi:Serine protease inhibitor Kazal-type 5 [Phlyctochytrium planicorne]|nr:Serine protease inhibitor Kazal-type 5 [Phlyctochytrium planicorne]
MLATTSIISLSLLSVASAAPIPGASSTPQDPCKDVGYVPVCANGLTYQNSCYFQQAQKTNPELKSVGFVSGPCNDWPVASPTPTQDACKDVGYVPVCANGLTYQNSCYFKQAQKTNPELQSVGFVDGACNDWPVASPPAPQDSCKDIGYVPVCANGLTYQNSCYFQQAQKTNPELQSVSFVSGPCNDWPVASPAPAQDACKDVGYAPVCAKGITFFNSCYFMDAKKRNPELTAVEFVNGACNDWPVASH